jgi:hypothetical protein
MVFKEDIMDEWQRRTGKPMHVLEEMLKVHANYLRKLSTDPEAANISLPKFCTLTFNYHMSANFRRKNQMTDIERAIKEKRMYQNQIKPTDDVFFQTPQILSHEVFESKDWVKNPMIHLDNLYDKHAEKYNRYAKEYFEE